MLKDYSSNGNTTHKIESASFLQNSKHNYKLLVSQKFTLPKLTHIKEVLLDTTDTRLLVQRMSKYKIESLYERKLAEFMLKIMHNILSCGAVLSKWNTEISEFCDICNTKENVFHILYKCKLSQYVWRKLGNSLDTVISPYDIYIGRRSKVFDNLTTQICYTIYKYRLKSWQSKQKRTECGLQIAIRNDLAWKLQVFKTMNEPEYTLLIKNVIKYW